MTDKNYLVKKEKGFTLIEAMVAISILLIAVVGPMSLIGNALHKIYYAKDEITAINLAQEGIEAVRQIRDSNMLFGANWVDNLTPGEYIIDINALATGGMPSSLVKSCTGSCNDTEKAVVYDNNAHLYRQGVAGMATTHFSRVITISAVGNERKVVSRVDWRVGNDTGTISISEYIFKWIPS